MPTIQASGLVKRYGELVAVDDVSLAVEPGEVFVLLGPNGAGKTTTTEILEGLRRPDGGGATVLGADPRSRRIAARIGVMPQESDLYQGIRTEEAVRLFASFYEAPEEADALMERLALDGVRRTTYRRLSGGERRRLSLAIALVGRPEVAFLDEPTSGMDVEGRQTTWNLLSELTERGTTVFVTTHLLDEAERFAHRVGIIHHGRLVAIGTPSELVAQRTSNVVFTTDRPIDAETLGGALGETVSPTGDNGYRITAIEPTPQLVARLTTWMSARGVLIKRLDTGARSLEDVYLELTR
jgi:ABC-2 type transport system ATP-binding protein